ncbi:hypothetical protein TVAGG3_0009630 [Trichomonas vaginalis G3]|uniref:hypothetical protein n=1 Tax=Trichomonas vaginalis (strain ATCC PRA-98 / G3) TaxID=412133 RepID=UPI0021E5571E|nr:hypothetical protein TVAGG3_0009630 [Trichomonas vaginalis G3]KAI5539077.1 hypothetical protein TVAGG3_0009630 [Trichomonas vaginalis G3]
MTLTNPMLRFSISIFIRMHPKLQLRSCVNFTYEQLNTSLTLLNPTVEGPEEEEGQFSTIESLSSRSHITAHTCPIQHYVRATYFPVMLFQISYKNYQCYAFQSLRAIFFPITVHR